MRRIIKTVPLFILIFVMLFTVGCKNAIKRDEAKAYINDFLDAVEADDYEQASSLLHPDVSIDLKAYFEKMEKDEWLDFSSIEIVRYTGFSSTYYSSNIGGSSYTQEMDVKIGDKEIEMEIELVRNDKGYGIYSIEIDE